jgi:hypothetical protein
VLAQKLRDIGLQRDQIGGVLRVPADRQRTGDVLVNQAQRPAKQVDTRRNDWRPDTRIVQHERFDQVIDVAAMVRGVHHAISRRGVDRRRRVLADAFDLSQDWVKRIFERAI